MISVSGVGLECMMDENWHPLLPLWYQSSWLILSERPSKGKRALTGFSSDIREWEKTESTSQFMKPWNLTEPHKNWERFMYSSVKGTNERQGVSLKGRFVRARNEASWNETTLMYSVILSDGFGQHGQAWVIHLWEILLPYKSSPLLLIKAK